MTGHAPQGDTEGTRVPFRVDPRLLRAILAGVAFLWHDGVPEAVKAELRDPSGSLLDALSELVEIRLEATDG